ncbi:MAG TPA: M20/M25/M40 family metallo-hydrolase [Thermoanaerobaculia bacterium]
MFRATVLPSALLVLLALPLAAAEPIDLEMVSRIRDEGLHRSQVMKTARHLTDEIGPRVTGSPQMKEANEWTRKQLADWGLANAHLEAYPFGRGWSLSRVSVHLLRPYPLPLLALPKAYTPGTGGPVRGTLTQVKIESDENLEPYKGKLAGKIVLLEISEAGRGREADPRVYSAEELDELSRFEIPEERDTDPRQRALERMRRRKLRNEFFSREKALATIEASSFPWGIVRVGGGGSFTPGEDPGPPALGMASEHYNQLARLIEGDREVELEIDVQARYHDDDLSSYNTLAEIPGTDRKGEVVMVGAHLDSWHAGTGATDNAAGVAVAMEAVRILRALDVKPRRTIRIALWSGEEQGMRGSSAYVAEHFGSRPEPEDPEQKALVPYQRKPTGPFKPKPEHGRLSVYFNLDNGTGKIRGVYVEENSAAAAIFEEWIRPLRDLGATTVTMRRTMGTDHVPFLDAGLPGFQLIQDGMEYLTHTHHSTMDVYDHLDREALMQSSVVLATFLYNAATRPEKMPKGPALP